MTRRVLCAALFASSILAPRLMAAEAVSYAIFKETDPIGRETMAIERNGDEIDVDVRTETRVKVLFLDFHYTHHRDEVWRDGHLERMSADTDDDGTVHHIDVAAGPDGPRLTLDGAPRDVPADALPLSLWSKAILDRKVLYGITDAALYHVTVTDLGTDDLTWKGRAVKSRHYRISGDVERDLWYGDDGLLLKTTFERRGYPILVMRE